MKLKVGFLVLVLISSFLVWYLTGSSDDLTIPAPVAGPISKTHAAGGVDVIPNENEAPLPESIQKKRNAAIRRALDEAWPNSEIGGLIEALDSDELVAELWRRNPKSATDWCLLTAYSKDDKAKLEAAQRWLSLDPKNIAAGLKVAFLENQDKPLSALTTQAQQALALGKLDLYEAARLTAFQTALNRAELGDGEGLFKVKTEKVAGAASSVLRRVLMESPAIAPLTQNGPKTSRHFLPNPDALSDDAVSVASSIVQLLSARPTRSMFEISELATSENTLLSQLPKDMEYGREGYTVEQRIQDAATETLEFRSMYETCWDKIQNDEALRKTYHSKVRAMGEYAAVKEFYDTIVKTN